MFGGALWDSKELMAQCTVPEQKRERETQKRIQKGVAAAIFYFLTLHLEK
jgi:hypothetical protein